MAKRTLLTEKSITADEAYLDEVDQVLTALRRLKNQIGSPVVKECLEAARADIAHLVGTSAEDEEEDEDDEDDEDDDEDDDFSEEEDDFVDDEDEDDEDEDEDDDDEDDEA
jgi:hypothetical protein